MVVAAVFHADTVVVIADGVFTSLQAKQVGRYQISSIKKTHLRVYGVKECITNLSLCLSVRTLTPIIPGLAKQNGMNIFWGH